MHSSPWFLPCTRGMTDGATPAALERGGRSGAELQWLGDRSSGGIQMGSVAGRGGGGDGEDREALDRWIGPVGKMRWSSVGWIDGWIGKAGECSGWAGESGGIPMGIW